MEDIFAALWIEGEKKPVCKFSNKSTCERMGVQSGLIFRRYLILKSIQDGCLTDSPYWIEPTKYQDVEVLHALLHALFDLNCVVNMTSMLGVSIKTAQSDAVRKLIKILKEMEGDECSNATGEWLLHDTWNSLDITKNPPAKYVPAQIRILFDLFCLAPIEYYIERGWLNNPITDKMRIFISNREEYVVSEKLTQERHDQV